MLSQEDMAFTSFLCFEYGLRSAVEDFISTANAALVV